MADIVLHGQLVLDSNGLPDMLNLPLDVSSSDNSLKLRRELASKPQEKSTPLTIEQCNIPAKICDASLLLNPLNNNEIFIICIVYGRNLFTQTIILKYYISSQRFECLYKFASATSASVVSSPKLLGSNNDNLTSTILVIAKNKQKMLQCATFDARQELINSQGLFFELNTTSNWQNLEVNHGDGYQALLYNNKWLFISGGDNDKYSNQMSIFELNSLTMMPLRLETSIILPKHYAYHGFIVYQKTILKMRDAKAEAEAETKEGKNEFRYKESVITLELLIFGGNKEIFQDSFLQISVKLFPQNENNTVTYQVKEFNVVNNIVTQYYSNRIKLVCKSKLSEFSYYLHKNKHWKRRIYLDCDDWVYFTYGFKYLFIIGGTDEIDDKMFDTIIYFDFETLRWNDGNKRSETLLPFGLCSHASVDVDINHNNNLNSVMNKSKNKNKNNFKNIHDQDKDIYVMGGLNCQMIEKRDCNFKFSINKFFQRKEWMIRRQIWIAFYKNDNNNDCLIDQLPKDIIKYILFLSQTEF